MANTRQRRFNPGVNMAGKMSPQQILIAQNEKVGNNHIQNMQGTTRNLYHFLPLDGRTNFNFFKELNKTGFPFTNIDQNKLGAGETLALQRAYLAYMNYDPTTKSVTVLTTVELMTGIGTAVCSGKWNFIQGNQNITKDIFAAVFNSRFNKASKFLGQGVYPFDTTATLLENVDFYSTLECPTTPVVTNGYLGLVVEGVGSILNLKTTS